jgi:hypothetical protein
MAAAFPPEVLDGDVSSRTRGKLAESTTAKRTRANGEVSDGEEASDDDATDDEYEELVRGERPQQAWVEVEGKDWKELKAQLDKILQRQEKRITMRYSQVRAFLFQQQRWELKPDLPVASVWVASRVCQSEE